MPVQRVSEGKAVVAQSQESVVRGEEPNRLRFPVCQRREALQELARRVLPVALYRTIS
jgi:hypothetical protein